MDSSKTSVVVFSVRFEAAEGPRLEVVSDQGQSAVVGTQLAAPLVVRLSDTAGLPVGAGASSSKSRRATACSTASCATWRVATDAQGQAGVGLTLGGRVGTGNHRVDELERASAEADAAARLIQDS